MADTPTEELRAKFEAWAESQGFNIHRDDSDKYRDYHRVTTRFAWDGFLAGHAAALAQQEPIQQPAKVCSAPSRTDAEKHAALKAADASGEVADSMAVRMALMERVRNREISLAEAQAELKRIKRGAKAAGKTTRAAVWRQS